MTMQQSNSSWSYEVVIICVPLHRPSSFNFNSLTKMNTAPTLRYNLWLKNEGKSVPLSISRVTGQLKLSYVNYMQGMQSGTHIGHHEEIDWVEIRIERCKNAICIITLGMHVNPANVKDFWDQCSFQELILEKRPWSVEKCFTCNVWSWHHIFLWEI